jgi:hypothetical protein
MDVRGLSWCWKKQAAFQAWDKMKWGDREDRPYWEESQWFVERGCKGIVSVDE